MTDDKYSVVIDGKTWYGTDALTALYLDFKKRKVDKKSIDKFKKGIVDGDDVPEDLLALVFFPIGIHKASCPCKICESVRNYYGYSLAEA